MTDRERTRWNNIRSRGYTRYLTVRGICVAVIWGAGMLLADYFPPFTRGHRYSRSHELLVLAVLSLIVGFVGAFLSWSEFERRYALDPARPEDLVSMLERENTRWRRFALFCLAAILILAAIAFRPR